MEKRRQYYGAVSEVFGLQGWKLMLEDMQVQIDNARESAIGATNLLELGRLQGRVGAFAEMLLIEDNIRAHMQALEEDDADLQL